MAYQSVGRYLNRNDKTSSVAKNTNTEYGEKKHLLDDGINLEVYDAGLMPNGRWATEAPVVSQLVR